MAKKAAAQKIQEEINTDEELERFLDRPGLLVLDIYSEWCGPCLGMVGSLKKIKLEAGGDNLSLAICKSDTIESLKRFRRKSEPTWLFVANGKAVNIMFGSDTPKLMNLILEELANLGNVKRPTYDITDYQPEEEIRRRAKEDVIAEAQRIEYEAKEKKRLEYLEHVTDVIMENLPDIGVTVFGPQVNRDIIKKIMEPADALKIQCKDRKFIEVTREQFETIHFKCPNPIEEDVLEQLDSKELLLCFWRVPGEGKDIPKILTNYAKELTKSHTYPPDEFNEEEIVVPPILGPLDLKVEVELKEGEIWIEEPEEPSSEENLAAKDDMGKPDLAIDEELEEEGDEANLEPLPPTEMPDLGFDLGLDDAIVEEVEEEEDVPIEAVTKKKIRIKKVRIPPIWIANNHRTHAALVYVFFRNQTTSFLPPDPVPEPPHIIMAFDTYKKRDLISHADHHKEDIPCYGFFTSDDAEEAEFIANSIEKYSPQTINDKLVLKVNKATSHTMLTLITYDPSYVSPNVNVGFDEAKKFFPESYKTAEQEMEEEAAQNDPDSAKKKKGAK
uniref:Thioredoxin n=1 Tax=Musca domestica TaxID=7370 RepID=A0A1I8N7U1_MUSDO